MTQENTKDDLDTAAVAIEDQPCKKAKTESTTDSTETTNNTNTNTNTNTDNTMGDLIQQSPDEEWPEAWKIEENVDDQKKPNKLEPHVSVDAAALRQLGIR